MLKGLVTDHVTVIGWVKPNILSTTSASTSAIAAANWPRMTLIASAGKKTATAKVYAGFTGAASAAASYTAITGTTTSSMATSGMMMVNLNTNTLSNTMTHVKGWIYVSAAKCTACSVHVLGFGPRNGPASDNDIASVRSIKNKVV